MEEVGFDCEFEMLTTRCMPPITLHAIPNTEPSQHNHPCLDMMQQRKGPFFRSWRPGTGRGLLATGLSESNSDRRHNHMPGPAARR